MNAAVTIPGEALYWAVLTLPAGAISASPGTQVVRHTRDLDELLEAFVPVPFESVKPAYVVLDNVRVLAVAADRERLVKACSAATTVVTPADVPGELRAVAPEGVVAALNLLWGDLEARPVVNARRRATLAAAAVLLAAAGLALIGLERRTAALRVGAEREEAATGKVLTEMYRKPTRDAGLIALDQEVSRLTRTRGGAARAVAPADASDALQRLLTAWPRPGPVAPGGSPLPAAKLRTESVSATADVITLSVAVEQREQAETLSAALRGMPGWRLPQPQFAAAPQGSGAATGGTLSFRLSADPVATTPAGGKGAP